MIVDVRAYGVRYGPLYRERTPYVQPFGWRGSGFYVYGAVRLAYGDW
jgi:hypothetical protein